MKKLVPESFDEYLNEDKIKGGKGDKLTSKDVCPNQLAVGRKVEKEHSSDKATATEIALDHLAEDKKYYSKLIENGMVDEEAAIKEYIKRFGDKKLPKKYKEIKESLNESKEVFYLKRTTGGNYSVETKGGNIEFEGRAEQILPFLTKVGDISVLEAKSLLNKVNQGARWAALLIDKSRFRLLR